MLGRMSQRQAAIAAGLARGTVAKIARGKHPHQRRPRTVARCAGCGAGLTCYPCPSCRVGAEAVARALAAARIAGPIGEDDPLRPDLKPTHRARYERLHEARDKTRADKPLGSLAPIP